VASISLKPLPIEIFGHCAELYNEDIGKIFRLSFPAFFAPKAEEAGLIVAHDNSGI
jgi:hypothetical protein